MVNWPAAGTYPGVWGADVGRGARPQDHAQPAVAGVTAALSSWEVHNQSVKMGE